MTARQRGAMSTHQPYVGTPHGGGRHGSGAPAMQHELARASRAVQQQYAGAPMLQLHSQHQGVAQHPGPQQHYYAAPPVQHYQGPQYRGPAHTAHGTAYWLLVGWWWEPMAWAGRMLLWLIFPVLGLWRSARKGQRNKESRARRGYR